jgi:hypothetical protein
MNTSQMNKVMRGIMSTLEEMSLQFIVGHFYLGLLEKVVFLRNSICLTQGRLNRAELKLSIDALLSYGTFYFPIIIENIDSEFIRKDDLIEQQANSSDIHKECRPGR